MTGHTRTDGLPGLALPPEVAGVSAVEGPPEKKVECNACPVLCRISPGRSGACDRYANVAGRLVRMDPVVVLDRVLAVGAAAGAPPAVVPFLLRSDGPHPEAGVGQPASTQPAATECAEDAAACGGGAARMFLTAVGASTTYPDYKPAPFIVSAPLDGVDMVTVVTEGIFSYCSFKVKIDTDRHLGAEQASVRCQGEVVGHVTTAEYGSQMLSLGGVHHLTGSSRKAGRTTCAVLEQLGNHQAVELRIDGGAHLVVQAGQPPQVNGVEESRMRVGCGSATVGIFAQQFQGLADEVVVLDDHITGVLSEHQAGRCLNMRPTGLRLHGRRSTPGRYFQVAGPGNGWGGTDISDPLSVIEGWLPGLAWPGLRLLLTSTTGEYAAWYELDAERVPQPAPMPAAVADVVARIGANCEPSLVSVLFLAGAGGSLRAGVTSHPIQLTQAIKAARVNVTCGGAPAWVWPGGGITVMCDVLRMPAGSFGSVPTPAIVAPIEFTMSRSEYQALGGHMAHVRPLAEVLRHGALHHDGAPQARRALAPVARNPWPVGGPPQLG